MQEVNKPNDIFVSTLLNPTSNVEDLIENGINGKNTGLLDPNVYKESEFVKKAFTDDESTLYIVKVKGVKAYQQLYEDEMYE